MQSVSFPPSPSLIRDNFQFPQPVGIPVEEISQEKKSALDTQVETWIDRSKTDKLAHTTIFEFCSKLSAKENWKMLSYALELFNSRGSKLEENIRLIWILQDNLEILFETQIAAFPQNILKIDTITPGELSFFPPLDLLETLHKVISAIDLLESSNKNIRVIKEEKLPKWKNYSTVLEQTLLSNTITCQDPPRFKSTPTFKLQKFMAYLWENQLVANLKVDNQPLLFWPQSSQECSLISFAPCFGAFVEIFKHNNKKICEELPTDIQDELLKCKDKLKQFELMETDRFQQGMLNEMKPRVARMTELFEKMSVATKNKLSQFTPDEFIQFMMKIQLGKTEELKDFLNSQEIEELTTLVHRFSEG